MGHEPDSPTRMSTHNRRVLSQELKCLNAPTQKSLSRRPILASLIISDNLPQPAPTQHCASKPMAVPVSSACFFELELQATPGRIGYGESRTGQWPVQVARAKGSVQQQNKR